MSLVEQLSQSAAYPHPVTLIQVRETHISWVFLTGEWAYKVKKPRQLGFLDYSSLAARKHFCEEELRLNRRFAPELYCAVVPICEAGGCLCIGGEGAIVDYAVKMRQFDDGALLSALAGSDGLDARLIRRLGRQLATTHAGLPSLYPRHGPGTVAAFNTTVSQNFEEIGEYLRSLSERADLDAVTAWIKGRLLEMAPEMALRIERGAVKDCHGDLHLGNIAVVDGQVRFFDCIEFNDAFRIVDTIAELAFLVMDIEARALPEQAWRLLNDYLEYAGDYAGLALFDIYACYYACVRAKVNLLCMDRRSEVLTNQPAYADFRHYLDLALSYTRPRTGFLAITHGVSGSGKSTVAMRVATDCAAVRIRSDVERKRLFGLAPECPSHSTHSGGIYGRDASRRTFDRLEQLARGVIQAGYACVVDATFLRRGQREPFRRLADELGVPLIIIQCEALPKTLRQRIRRRNTLAEDASEADEKIMAGQMGAVEKPQADEAQGIVKIDEGVDADEIGPAVRRLVEAAD